MLIIPMTEETTVRRPHQLIAVAALPVLLLSACGGSDSDEAAPPAPTGTTAAPAATSAAATSAAAAAPDAFPCDALTVAEVGAVAGDTYTASTGPLGECEYKPTDARNKPQFSVEIPDGEFDLSGINNATDVPGIGVRAVTRRDTNFPDVTIGTVQLDAAGKVIRVSVAGGPDSSRDSDTAAVLKLAFSKL